MNNLWYLNHEVNRYFMKMDLTESESIVKAGFVLPICSAFIFRSYLLKRKLLLRKVSLSKYNSPCQKLMRRILKSFLKTLLLQLKPVMFKNLQNLLSFIGLKNLIYLPHFQAKLVFIYY